MKDHQEDERSRYIFKMVTESPLATQTKVLTGNASLSALKHRDISHIKVKTKDQDKESNSHRTGKSYYR